MQHAEARLVELRTRLEEVHRTPTNEVAEELRAALAKAANAPAHVSMCRILRERAKRTVRGAGEQGR